MGKELQRGVGVLRWRDVSAFFAAGRGEIEQMVVEGEEF